jgi:hypothetical protein
MYLTALADGFGSDIDYATLVKAYGNDPEGEKRYSPAICRGCKNGQDDEGPTGGTSTRSATRRPAVAGARKGQVQ